MGHASNWAQTGWIPNSAGSEILGKSPRVLGCQKGLGIFVLMG